MASSRLGGNTHALAGWALAGPLGKPHDLNAMRMGHFSYTNAHADDDFLPLATQLLSPSLWVLATPVHWYTMSAQAKVFLDRLTDLLDFHPDMGRQLRGKSLAVLCTGTETHLPPAFDEPFALTCGYLGMQYRGSFYAQFEDGLAVDPGAASKARDFYAGLQQWPVTAQKASPHAHRESLSAHLYALETELLQNATRTCAARVSELLHDDFSEVGQSGVVWSKAAVIERLQAETLQGSVLRQLSEFKLIHADACTACVTYIATRFGPAAGGNRDAAPAPLSASGRSSVWVLVCGQWRMLRHHGTVLAAYAHTP